MKRYVLAGTGHRGITAYIQPITEQFQDDAKLCGLYDKNPLRAAQAAAMAAYDVPVYDDWDQLLRDVKPDAAIITTVDATHAKYIISAMEAGCDVISEKPVTTDEHMLNEIFQSRRRTGKNLTVTFNARFMPIFMRVKELVCSGAIGEILNVHYEWLLDTSHGADYFRRWHRQRKNSGSLLIHKATHHFDIMNWLLDDIPMKVNAFGSRRFYGAGERAGGVNCRSCARAGSCEFYFDIEADPFYRAIYTGCESVDGYLRDRCVFSDEIDIEDSVNLSIRYKGGASASYTLTAHSPYEGVALMLNGREGRLELRLRMGGGAYAGATASDIRIYNRLGEEIRYHIPENHITQTMREVGELARSMEAGGSHGGSDAMLRMALFRGLTRDPLGLMAGLEDGAYSVGIGIAANISMREDRAVSLDEFMGFV